jgi:hypothetical protein
MGTAKTAEQDIAAATVISVLQNLQSRLLQALRNHKIGTAPTPAEQRSVSPTCPCAIAEAAEPSSAAAEPAIPAPANSDDTFAADVRRLCAFKPEAGYVESLRDAFADAKLLSACAQAMVARGDSYAYSELLFSQFQYLYWQQDGQFPSPFIEDERCHQQASRKLRRPQ